MSIRYYSVLMSSNSRQPVLPTSKLRVAALTFALWLLAGVGGLSRQVQPPNLVVEAPDSLRAIAERIRSFDRARLAAIMTLTGLPAPGAPIRVVLLPEETALARDTPPWVAAFADATRDLVVLFPTRIGSYPYDSLDVVLHHEVAHILLARAAAGGRIPRWFNEGVASMAERSWDLSVRSRFAWEATVGGSISITQLEGLFGKGRREAVRAYVVAHALVRDLLQHYGAGIVSSILARMTAGETFDQAFIAGTGTTASGAMQAFWQRTTNWERWIAFAARPLTLWTLVTALALLAIWKQRRRRAEKRRQWEAEERATAQAWEECQRRHQIH